MIILYTLGIIYLVIGFVYATYILLFGYDRWYMFPVNTLLGLPFILYIIYISKTGKRLPF